MARLPRGSTRWFDLTDFSLRDMTECGSALRTLGGDADGLHEAMQRIAQYLFRCLRDCEWAGEQRVLVRGVVTRSFPDMDVTDRALAPLALVRTSRSPVMKRLTLAGTAGTDAVKQVNQARPEMPGIVLSMHPGNQDAVRMFRAGADGHLNKANTPQEVVSAVKKVVSGGQYVSPAVAERLALTVQAQDSEPAHERLSDHEFEVLRLIASGQTVSEVAESLDLNVTTVSAYRARILDKMQLKNNAVLTRYALQHRLVD